ncbi:MAG: PAS domain-containing protein [Micropepsaceae bacterium]
MSMGQFSRSAQSVHFEEVLRVASQPGALPRRVDIDAATLQNLMPWIAIVEPNNVTRTLKIEMAGTGICQVLGREAVGIDYLDIVDPAIKGDAFDSTFVMLTRPCGLWQMTPGLTEAGGNVMVEYTGYPIFDHVRGCGQIMFLIQFIQDDVARTPRIVMVKHATAWDWLEVRSSVPA